MGDFTVPTAIHKKTWDYPLMPEKASIPEEDQLSPKQVELNENNRTKHSSHLQYLLQTMWDKHHYFVYGEVTAGLLSATGHRDGTPVLWHCVQCEGVWLKPYVDMNTELRNKCKEEGQAIGTIVYKQAHEQCHLWEVPPECDEAEQPQVCQHTAGCHSNQGAVTAWLCEECVS